MSDKELLELAAKATGGWLYDGTDGLCICNPTSRAKLWNPLVDDGDALRLAVALNLDILQEPVSSKSNAVEVEANIEGIEFQPWAWECRAPDPCAATRRAIVRAAAEIGKSNHGDK